MILYDIAKGIAEKLNAEFGDGYTVYTEDIEQGLEESEPCFFIQCVTPTNERFLGNRRKLTNQFAIQYFSKNEETYRGYMDVFYRLVECLTWIKIDGMPQEGHGFSYVISDNVLTVMVDYDFFAMVEHENGPLMESMELEGYYGNCNE